VSGAVESLFVGRLLVLIPSLIILALMPGLMIKLNHAISTEELTKTALLQDIMRDSRRDTFLASLRSLIAFTVLFGDGENNIMNKLAQIKAMEAALKTNPKALPVPRRSAEEDNRALNVYSREELGLLEAAFVQGADDWEREGAAVGITLNAPQVASVLMSLGLSLSDEDAKVLFDFMDRDGNGSIDLLEFASVLILPLSGPVTAGLFEEGVERLFKILDQNGDGQVTLDEFRSEMAKVFPNWNPDALVPLFREIDSGESGAIDKNEFLAYVRNAL
jgi:calmodulin